MAITQVPDESVPTQVIADDISEESFDSFAQTMPDSASGFLESAQESTESDTSSFIDSASSEQTVEPRKRVDISKKMRKAMNKFKSKVANVPIMWFHTQAKNNPEWELDDEEKELITDSIEMVFEVLDIGIEIQPLSITLESIWWIISYPILSFVFLFLTKKSLSIEREQREQAGIE